MCYNAFSLEAEEKSSRYNDYLHNPQHHKDTGRQDIGLAATVV